MRWVESSMGGRDFFGNVKKERWKKNYKYFKLKYFWSPANMWPSILIDTVLQVIYIYISNSIVLVFFHVQKKTCSSAVLMYIDYMPNTVSKIFQTSSVSDSQGLSEFIHLSISLFLCNESPLKLYFLPSLIISALVPEACFKWCSSCVHFHFSSHKLVDVCCHLCFRSVVF